jgi:o-succinylbenzoate---CoA ligase
VELKGPFIINNKKFSKEELFSFSEKMLSSSALSKWESSLYKFIIDFFTESKSIQQKTSGTTGDPKTQILNRNAMLNSAEMTLKHFNLKKGSKVLLCLPIEYIAGKMMVIRSLLGGLNIITAEPSSRPLANLSEEIDFAAMVPMQVYESIANFDSLERIGKLLIGGGEIDQSLLSKIKKLKRVEVIESFAMTETYTHFATRRINGDNPETYFELMDNVSIEMDDRGCLLVEIRGVTDGKVVTNDLVSIEDNSKFKCLGRIDNILKSGGIKIIPELLEGKIKQHIPAELIIIGMPDKKLGQKLVLVIEGDENKIPLDSWMTKLTGILERHEIPREIVAIRSIPRNISMKFDRKATAKILLN